MHLSWTCQAAVAATAAAAAPAQKSSRWPRPALHCAHDEAEVGAGAVADAGVQSLGPVGGQQLHANGQQLPQLPQQQQQQKK